MVAERQHLRQRNTWCTREMPSTPDPSPARRCRASTHKRQDAGGPPREEVESKEQEVEDERAARYRAAYEDLGLRVVAHPDGTLEASWQFGEGVVHNGSDKLKNKRATKHFHSTKHPGVRSFQPGEDRRWCYVDEVMV